MCCLQKFLLICSVDIYRKISDQLLIIHIQFKNKKGNKKEKKFVYPLSKKSNETHFNLKIIFLLLSKKKKNISLWIRTLLAVYVILW